MIMKNYYLIALLFITAFTQAQIVNIPDANFKDALVNTLCVDTDGDGVGDSDADINNDGEIQVSEVEDLTWLFISSRYIDSVEGIQSFTNLQVLICTANNLTILDLSQNLNLISLNCSYNQLTNLNLVDNINLINLECYNNELSTLDVTQNTNLEVLECRLNQITSLDISQNFKLTSLWFSFNDIATIDVAHLVDLEKLRFARNLLTEIDVTQNLNLRLLSFPNNQITNINLAQNVALENIDFGDNLITQIDFLPNPNLKYVSCSNNSLVNLDLSHNPNIEKLYCNNGSLSNLNIKNGNNINIRFVQVQDNPNLTCIQVDDENATYPVCDPPNLSGWCKDSTAVYSEECVLGLEEYDSIAFTMFPNPTQDVLNIESKETIESIIIYSIQGQLVKEISSSSIDVSALTNGIYFAQVSSEGKTTTKKFIKL